MAELDGVRFGRVYSKSIVIKSKYLNGVSGPIPGKTIPTSGPHPIVNPGQFLPKLLDKEGFII